MEIHTGKKEKAHGVSAILQKFLWKSSFLDIFQKYPTDAVKEI